MEVSALSENYSDLQSITVVDVMKTHEAFVFATPTIVKTAVITYTG